MKKNSTSLRPCLLGCDNLHSSAAHTLSLFLFLRFAVSGILRRDARPAAGRCAPGRGGGGAGEAVRRVGARAVPWLTSGACGTGHRRRGSCGSGAAPGRGAGSPGAVGADGGRRDPRISYRARGGRSFLFSACAPSISVSYSLWRRKGNAVR